MSKRLNIVLIVLAIGGFAWLMRPSRIPHGPRFEDQALTTWLDHHVASSAAVPPYNSPGWLKADEALRSIGTNGIPTLLKMMEAKDPPAPVMKLLQWARRHSWRINYHSAISRNEEAEYAFQVLKTNAVAAVPELIRIYNKAVSPTSQNCAASALGHIGRGAKAALPSLVRNFSDTNHDVRFHAVSAVMRIGGDYNFVGPALTAALKDPDVNVRWNALVGLGSFGDRARPSVPAILAMLNDPGMVGTSSITQAVKTALWRIAPEQVGNPLLVETDTPIITNGITSGELKFQFKGERRTLLRAGRSVPAVAQFWNRDPRPEFTLYRSPNQTETGDQLLGHFEVLDVPQSQSVNVSTLCVIANGQLFLCARDNNGEVFLEIRRVNEAAP